MFSRGVVPGWLSSLVMLASISAACSGSPPARQDGGGGSAGNGGQAGSGSPDGGAGSTGRGGSAGIAGSAGSTGGSSTGGSTATEGTGGSAPAGSGGSTAGSGGSAGIGGSAGGAGSAGTGGRGGSTGGATAGTGGSAGGGTGGTSGSAGAGGGTGGTSGSAGAGAGGGSAGTGGGSGAGASAGTAGGGGTGGVGCGEAGQACCATNSCSAGLICLNGTSCSCAKELYGRYMLRTDNKLLYQTDPSSTAQTPVLDAATGFALTDVAAAFEGPAHGCALISTSKTVSCWRTAANGNNAGQLGSGAIDTSGPVFRATPVLLAANQPLTNVAVLAHGTSSSGNPSRNDTSNTCAATADGKLYCWGALGFLTNGATADLNTPFATLITTDGVTPFTGVIQVSLNNTFACALVQGATAKEVWCWGSNAVGNLGTGDTTLRRYPTKVVGFTSPTKVMTFGYPGNVAYNNGTVCVLDGANVRCWGSNNTGQVGNGSTNTPVLAPTLVTLMGGVTPLANVIDLFGGGRTPNGGYQDVCALTADHKAICWGSPFESYPTTYGTANIISIGSMDDAAIRFLTSDGLYHYAPNNGSAATTRMPNCGLVP